MTRYYDNITLSPYRLPVHIPETYARPLDDYYKRDRLIHLREHHSNHRRDRERYRHHYH